MCSDIPGCKVDVWMSGTLPEKLQARGEHTTNRSHRPQND